MGCARDGSYLLEQRSGLAVKRFAGSNPVASTEWPVSHLVDHGPNAAAQQKAEPPVRRGGAPGARVGLDRHPR